MPTSTTTGASPRQEEIDPIASYIERKICPEKHDVIAGQLCSICRASVHEVRSANHRIPKT